MCLLGLAFQILPDCPVALLANREEFYGRPTESPRRHPREGARLGWLGGVDLQAGGTWLGVNERGIVVAVTNRRKTNPPENPVSRGLLCRELLGLDSVDAALAEAQRQLRQRSFAGCNFVIVDASRGFVIEAGDRLVTKPLTPGLHFMTNADLNDPADVRIRRARSTMESVGAVEADEWAAEAKGLCGAGATVDQNGEQPAICFTGPDRGTVSSTIITLPDDVHQSLYYYADGPPSQTAYVDLSLLLRKQLWGDSGRIHQRPAASVHCIRLRGPWQFEPLGRLQFDPQGETTWQPGQLPAAGTAHFPIPWQSLFGEFRGRVRFRRRFHRPTNLDPGEQVWLSFLAVGGAGDVFVNGACVGKLESRVTPQAFEITNRLRGDDELLVELTFSEPPANPAPGGLFAPIQLEMHTTLPSTPAQ